MPFICRSSSRTSRAFPNCREAARRASSGLIPSRTYRSVSSSRWLSNSARASSSTRWRARAKRRRERSATTRLHMSGLPSALEKSRHHACNPLPILGLRAQLPASSIGDGVEARLSIVVGGSPAGRNPPALQQTHQRRVDSPLVQLQGVLADLLDTARNAVPVQRPHGAEGLQHHQVEGALQYLSPR